MVPFHHSAAARPADGALIWPWAPNWAVPPVEALSWHTTLHRSKGAREQRRSLRRAPRAASTYAYLLTGPEASLAGRMTTAWAMRPWCVPRWEHALPVTGTAGPVVTVAGDPSALALAGATMVLWNSPDDITPVTAVSSNSTSVTLAAPASNAAYLVPCLFAYLPESSTSTVVAGAVTTLQVTFSPLACPEAPPSSKWLSIFPSDGEMLDPRSHLLRMRHVNWADGVGSTTVARTFRFDTEQAEPVFLPGSLVPQRSLGLRIGAFGEDRGKWRDFILARQGQAVGFFVEHPEIALTGPLDISGGALPLPGLSLWDHPELAYCGVSLTADAVLGTLPGSSLSGSVVSGSVGITSIAVGGELSFPPLSFTGITFLTSGLPAYNFSGDALTLTPTLEVGNWELRFTQVAADSWKVWVRGDRIAAITNGGNAKFLSENQSLASARVVAQADTPSGGVSIRAVNGAIEINGNACGSYAGKGVLSVGYIGSPEFSGVIGGVSISLVGWEGAYEVASFSGGLVTLVGAPALLSSAKNVRLISAARLASDTVEFTHHNPSVAEINLPVITTDVDEIPARATAGFGPLSPYSPFSLYSETTPALPVAPGIPAVGLTSAFFSAPSFASPSSSVTLGTPYVSGFTASSTSLVGGSSFADWVYGGNMSGSMDISSGVSLKMIAHRVGEAGDWMLGATAYFGFSGYLSFFIRKITTYFEGVVPLGRVTMVYGGASTSVEVPELLLLADGDPHVIDLFASTAGIFVRVDGVAVASAAGPSSSVTSPESTGGVAVSSYNEGSYLPCPFEITTLQVGSLGSVEPAAPASWSDPVLLSSIPDQTAHLGTPFSVDVSSHFSGYSTWRYSGVPFWASVNGPVIAGTPDATASDTVTVSAYNTSGHFTSTSFTIVTTA